MKCKILTKYNITVYENGTIIGKSKKLMVGEINKDGYIRVNVSYYENGKRIRKHKFVHRLVAEAFLENYSENLVINHKDCNKQNNNISNIEMCTIKENTIHAFNNNLCLNLEGENSHLNKYPESLIKQILIELENVERYENGNIKAGELKKIAEKLNTTRFVVKNYSRKRKTWKYLNRSATTIPAEGVDSSESKSQPSQADDDIV